MSKKITKSICKRIANLAFSIESMRDDGTVLDKVQDKIDAMQFDIQDINENDKMTEEQKQEAIKAIHKTEAKLKKEMEELEEFLETIDDVVSGLLSTAEEFATVHDVTWDPYD